MQMWLLPIANTVHHGSDELMPDVNQGALGRARNEGLASKPEPWAESQTLSATL